MKLKSNNTKSVNENLKRSSSELEVIKFKTFREKSIMFNSRVSSQKLGATIKWNITKDIM